MTGHSPMLDAAWAERIGWTLVHSVWQVTIVVAAFAVVSFALRRTSASTRYVLGCAALAVMVAWPAATCLRMEHAEPDTNQRLSLRLYLEADPVSVAADAGTNEAITSSKSAPAPQPPLELAPFDRLRRDWNSAKDAVAKWSESIETALPWLTTGWLLGVALLALRPMWGLMVVRRLRTHGLTPLCDDLRRTAGRLMARLRIAQAVQFAESEIVEVPTVVGYLRPMVLLPASAVTGLSAEQLELVLAHELAHVRRHDYLVNLLQTLVEALLFYHPGMWWVTAQVRRERENCCDDVAVQVCGNRGQYIRALYTLEARRGDAAPALTANGGSLVERIRRLVLRPPAATAYDRTAAWMAGLMALLLVAVVFSLGKLYAGVEVEQAAEVEQVAEVADVPPADDSNAEALEAKETADETRSIEQVVPTLPTFAECPIKKALQARIAMAADEVRQRGEGHVIVGRVLVEGDDDPTEVHAQMEILGEGYFAGPVLDLHHPVGFRMHGYAPYDLELAGDDEPVVDVGTIQMRRLSEDKLVPVVGRVELEDGGDPTTATLSFTVSDGPVNTPSRGTEPRSRWPDPIELRPDENGRFYRPDFSPIKYHLVVAAPGYVRQDRPVSITADGAADLGTIRLEKPLLLAVDYIVTEELPFRLADVKTAALEGGARWQIVPRQHGWDLEFDQRQGQLYFDWSYGPVFLAHLGPGDLADYLDADGRVATRQPREFVVEDGHVYLLRRPNWEQGSGEYLALFKVRLGGGSATPATKKPPGKPVVSTPSKPWIATGKITDENGLPLIGVQVKAFAGVATLRNTGTATTDSRGMYRLAFGPGVGFARGSNFVQAATISARLPGYFEQNLCRQGNCVAGYAEPDDDDLARWDSKPDQVFLPGEPKTIDFVMRPAAVLEGEFVETSHNWNVREQKFFLVGDELPPSQSVLTTVTTDDRGRFRVDAIPTGREWRIGMRVPHTGLEIETRPVRFDEPGVYRCKLVLDARSGDGGVAMSLRVDGLERVATAEQARAIDRLDDQGFSKLHRAAMGGHTDQVRELLKAGANIDVRQGTYQGTPLQYAASGGHGETVQALLDGRAMIDAQDTNGRTPLMWAAMKGHADVVRRLLDARAGVNARNIGGWTPLHYAVSNGHEEVAQLLIDRGANVRATNSQGRTPFALNPNLDLRIPWQALEPPEPPAESREPRHPPVEDPPAPIDSMRPAAKVSDGLADFAPDAVVATVRGKPIAGREITPSPEWFEQRKRAGGEGFETPKVYTVNRLRAAVLTPLFDQYRQEHSLEPTEAEIDEYLEQVRRLREQRRRGTAEEIRRVAQEVAAAEQHVQAGNLSTVEQQALKRQIARDRERVAELKRQLALDVKLAQAADESEQARRQFTRQTLRNWKLQQSLYQEYGGRAIWQQAGPEALDAMRDFLKEKEVAGEFAILDPQMRELFWEYFLNDQMHVFLPDPDKVFGHPWSGFDSAQ